jgi:hypothetical protein
MVLFSSPSGERWLYGDKESSDTVALGMELWTKDEFMEWDEQKLYPRTLCKKESSKLLEITGLLRRFGCEQPASEVYRRNLFGSQARFEYSEDEALISTRVGTFADSLAAVAAKLSSLDLLTNDKTDFLHLFDTHKIKELQYDVSTRVFYEQFVSGYIIELLAENIEKNKEDKYKEFLYTIKIQESEAYRHHFESYVRGFLYRGFKGSVSPLNSNEKNNFSFDVLGICSGFVYKTYGLHKFQILLEKDTSCLLGVNLPEKPVLLSPTEIGCAAIDDIVMIPPQKSDPNLAFHIVFVQTTVGTDHPITRSGILGMLLLAMAVEFSSGVAPIVSFCFIVPEELVQDYKTPHGQLLKEIFNNVEIFAVSINDYLSGAKIESFYFRKKSLQIASSFSTEFSKERQEILASSSTNSFSCFSNSGIKIKKPQIKLVKLFTGISSSFFPSSFGLGDAIFRVISEKEQWGRVELSISASKILASRFDENEKGNEKEKEENEENKEGRKENEGKENKKEGEEGAKAKTKEERNKNKKNINDPDNFSDLYDYLFSDIPNGSYNFKKAISFSKCYSKSFICKVIHLMFDAVDVDETKLNDITTYALKIVLKNASSAKPFDDFLKNKNSFNFMGILQNVQNISKTQFL